MNLTKQFGKEKKYNHWPLKQLKFNKKLTDDGCGRTNIGVYRVMKHVTKNPGGPLR